MSRSRRTCRRVVSAVALAVGLFFTDLAVTFYRIYSAPPPADLTPTYLLPEYHQLMRSLSEHGYWTMDEYHGRYYNVEPDGSRRTIGQPARYERTVWMFGNSGLFDPDVPDAQTCASDLQALFNQASYPYRVVNYGAFSQAITGQLAWLKDAPVQRGDIVVFLDGAGLDVDVARYHRTVDAARFYAHSQGATFYHFVQPDQADFSRFGTPRIIVPADGFVEGAHMNASGDAIAARAIFQWIALI